jgi:hypothetical protein
LGTLTPDQRTQQMQQLNQSFYKNFATPTNDIITNPQMRTRFNQLYNQYRGYDAFQDPAIQSKLNLTDAQRQKLSQYQSDWQRSMNNLSATYRTDPQAATRQFNDMRKQQTEQLNNLLNDQQRQTWSQMTGEPFNVQPSIYFPSSSSTPSTK